VAHLERMRAALERARPRDQRQRPIIAERQIADMDVTRLRLLCGHEGVLAGKGEAFSQARALASLSSCPRKRASRGRRQKLEIP
jgi:hypothetical protein